MRQLIAGLVAAVAVVTVSAAPAAACGGGLFSGCSPCASYSPCGTGFGAGYGGSYGFAGGYGYAGGYGGGYEVGYGGGGYQQLPDPAQYYYVNQGPVYSGPANFAPRPYYQESRVTGYYNNTYRAAPSWRRAAYGYRGGYARPWRAGHYGVARPAYRYGYGARQSYRSQYSAGPRHGYHHGRAMRRYY
jgi:hypothetical protein